MIPFVPPLVLALALTGAGAGTLDVPFLPQTPALCGGAAAAMVFRYWGDRHADVQQFAPLVDERAGGIADAVLIDAVQQRGWVTHVAAGSVELLRERLAAGQPVIILIEDRPTRYHYVVAVGADDEHIWLHDPTWGPARKYRVDRLLRLWRPSNFWMLVILPGLKGPADLPGTGTSVPGTGTPAASRPKTECDRRLDAAIDEIAKRGFDSADAVLSDVARACPDAAAPLAELAGVRFAQKRWQEAESLAGRAIARDPSHAYTWDVLASARFVQNDFAGALRAWNRVGKPLVDSVAISGLKRTRYALVADALGVTPNSVLTERAYRLAERRLQQLPSRSAARMTYRPQEDGFAIVEVAIVESAIVPLAWAPAAAVAADALVSRDLTLSAPGWTGEGELWTAGWRWWKDRPRIAATFSAPRALGLPGVVRLSASWEAQTYTAGAATDREERLHASVVVSDWAAPDVRYEMSVGLDSWRSSGAAARKPERGELRSLSVGGTIERRLFGDRVAVAAGGHQYFGIRGATGFRHGAAAAAYRSSQSTRGWVQLVNGRLEAAAGGAPMALWPGAGEGVARAALLRAHPLLHDGVVSGPVFGRRLVQATTELQRWLRRPSAIPLALAVFVDAAAADLGRAAGKAGRTPLHVDLGIGVRVKLPGTDRMIRVDHARGMRDGRSAVTAGMVLDAGRLF